MTLYDDVTEANAAIRRKTDLRPSVALILGSGLGDIATALRDATAFPYEELPHFAHSTVIGHAGRLLLGYLEDVPVVVMQGRFHFYEGYALSVVTFPVRVMSALGAQTLIVTNAAGGLNPTYRPGDIMVIRDHINMPGLAGQNPLTGPNEERFGPRFLPLADAYDSGLRALAHTAATAAPGSILQEGVYVMVGGPNYETRAELKFLRLIGADAVGMSTVPEVIVARHMGMRVLGLSLITNAATGEETGEVNHAEVLAAADAARPKFTTLVSGIVRRAATTV
jgi:purine-nucleoside phosphorylase